MPNNQEEIQELLEEGADLHGPLETYLYSQGGEYWPSDIGLQLDRLTETSLNDTNSYVGWYHVRNYGSQYQTIIPEAEYDETYDGPVLYTYGKFLQKAGRLDLIDPASVLPPIRGCKNPNAFNYNPLATVDDGSCLVLPGYMLGQIPPETLTGLHTHGGELRKHNGHEYYGYYHVHGPGGLPAGVTAGWIMTGREYNASTSHRLYVKNVGDRYMESYNESEPTPELWNSIIKQSADGNADEQDILDIAVELTGDNRNYEYHTINNRIQLTTATQLLDVADYQFTSLITDERTPGIYGTKPILKTNLNDIIFDEDGLKESPPGASVKDFTEGSALDLIQFDDRTVTDGEDLDPENYIVNETPPVEE